MMGQGRFMRAPVARTGASLARARATISAFFFVWLDSQRRIVVAACFTVSTVFGLGAILSLWLAELRPDPMSAATRQPFGQPTSRVAVVLECTAVKDKQQGCSLVSYRR